MEYITDEEIASAIYATKKILAECLEMNSVPHSIGLSALHSVIASTMKEHRDFEHYKDFMQQAMELTEQHWNDL